MFAQVIPQELVLLIPVLLHVLTALFEFFDPLRHLAIGVVDELIGVAIANHELENELEESLVAVDESLFLRE